MAGVSAVSEEFTNRSQSWIFSGVYRTAHGLYEVEVRKNAYPDQSWAKISIWSPTDKGWEYFVSLPTEKWYTTTPSYTRKALTDADKGSFWDIRDILLGKLGKALWNDADVKIYGETV